MFKPPTKMQLLKATTFNSEDLSGLKRRENTSHYHQERYVVLRTISQCAVWILTLAKRSMYFLSYQSSLPEQLFEAKNFAKLSVLLMTQYWWLKKGLLYVNA